MTGVDWGDYESYVPPVLGLPGEMSRSDARIAYQHAMEHKGERIEILRTLARRNSVPIRADRASIDAFGRWLVSSVRRDPAEPGRLADPWYGVVFDTGLLVGDLIINENPVLGWKLQGGGRSHIWFQKPVISGYPSDARYSVDPDWYVAGLAHRASVNEDSQQASLWEYVRISAQD